MSDPSESPVLQIEHLKIALPANADRGLAVDDVGFSIPAGRTLCVVGESGSGKSVLAMAVMGLLARGLEVRSGRIVLTGQTLLEGERRLAEPQWRALRGSRIGMVFQEPTTALNPVVSCGAQVDELLRAHTSWARSRRRTRVLEMFAQVRLPDPEHLYDTYPHQLSGGQRQRVVIAMAMILRPRLLICDEPTTALDVTTQAEILKLVARLQAEEQSAVLFITHDMGVVAEIAHEILVMHDGRAVEQGRAEAVLRHPREAYTQMLLSSVPGLTPPPPREIPGASDAPSLRAVSVGKTYAAQHRFIRRTSRPALHGASLAIHPGETVGIVGESGSGKSTLARCLIRLIEPSLGDIYWGEAAVARLGEAHLRALRSRVQIVFQDPNRSLNPRRAVGKSLVEGAMNFGADSRDAQALAAELMDRVRLPRSALARFPHQFSGGQRQRLAIARALACRPSVLIADEAVSALDVSIQAQILDLFRALQSELGVALLFITHDLRVAAQICDRVIVMHEGSIIEEGLTSVLYRDPREPYTQRLLAAAPRLDARREAVLPSSEELPDRAPIGVPIARP
ncbi:MAG: ABC transporter ATP-binding protein [Burkholderiaceae bacterium]